MSSVSLRLIETGIHVHITVFAGPDPDHRAMLGTLAARRGEEADEIVRRLTAEDESAEVLSYGDFA